MKKFVAIVILIVIMTTFTGCYFENNSSSGSKDDIKKTQEVADVLQTNQPTPTDIDYSLERYNLIRRAYWVNGQREKANALVCEVTKPMGYIVLFTGSAVVGTFTVDGKVSSLNSFLTPNSVDSAYGNSSGGYTTLNKELPDIDGSYGENDAGIFFFTTDGKYVEWTGMYLYTDIPMKVESPVVKFEPQE